MPQRDSRKEGPGGPGGTGLACFSRDCTVGTFVLASSSRRRSHCIHRSRPSSAGARDVDDRHLPTHAPGVVACFVNVDRLRRNTLNYGSRGTEFVHRRGTLRPQHRLSTAPRSTSAAEPASEPPLPSRPCPTRQMPGTTRPNPRAHNRGWGGLAPAGKCIEPGPEGDPNDKT